MVEQALGLRCCLGAANCIPTNGEKKNGIKYFILSTATYHRLTPGDPFGRDGNGRMPIAYGRCM